MMANSACFLPDVVQNDGGLSYRHSRSSKRLCIYSRGGSRLFHVR